MVQKETDSVLEVSLNAHRMVGQSVLQAMRQLVLSNGYGVRRQETRTVSISLSHTLLRITKACIFKNMHNYFATTG